MCTGTFRYLRSMNFPQTPSPHPSTFTKFCFGDISMQLLALFVCLIGILHHAEAAGKTHIYIDQVPIYTKLASCAQDRISAIVRAQASGCGDDTQLTSFACFCIDSSSQFASIISTAVEDQCSSAATEAALTARHAVLQTPVNRVRARATVTPAPTSAGAVAGDVKGALEVFDSYCSKSTELPRFQQSATHSITEAPQTVFVTPTSAASIATDASEKKNSTPVAAIVVPLILIPLALGVALWFFLRYRRQQRDFGNKLQDLHADTVVAQTYPVVISDQKGMYPQYGTELYAAQPRFEMPLNQNPAVELDAGAEWTAKKNEKLGSI